MTTTADPIHGDRRNENRETRTVDYYCRTHGWVTVEQVPLRFAHRDCIPVADTVEDAVNLLDQVRARYEWVSVFWDRGWGDSGESAEISIIEDGDGQWPRAYLTESVYERLVVGGAVEPNSLRTFKARKLHDYRPPPPGPRDPEAWRLADQVAAAWLAETFPNFDDDSSRIVYGMDAAPPRVAFGVGVNADLDGFWINAFDDARGLGPDLIPLGDHGLGFGVPYAHHPSDPEWVATRPRLEAAVRFALAAVAAHREGRVCGAPHPDPGKYQWACRRPAGHDTADPITPAGTRWDLHAMTSGHVWDAEGVIQK